MNIIFRADASVDIGTGHIYRCLTLAEELKNRGADISFICREENGSLIDFIKKKGYDVYPLPAGIGLDEDLRLTKEILKRQKKMPDWLVIDHYGIDIKWEASVRLLVKRIMVIDDLANRKHDCDILLDQNYNDDDSRYSTLVPDSCVKLLGPQYALLRPQFRKARKKMGECRSKVKKIFIFMGGADSANVTCKVLRAVKMLERPYLTVDVVIGMANPNRDEIERLASNIPGAVCHYKVENMAELMIAADICIGAGGSITWERSCLGLPSIVMVLSENQMFVAKQLDKMGAVINLGPNERVAEDAIRAAVEELINNYDKRCSMSFKSQSIVDCRGVERVASVICTPDR